MVLSSFNFDLISVGPKKNNHQRRRRRRRRERGREEYGFVGDDVLADREAHAGAEGEGGGGGAGEEGVAAHDSGGGAAQSAGHVFVSFCFPIFSSKRDHGLTDHGHRLALLLPTHGLGLC